MATILDGKALAQKMQSQLADKVAHFVAQGYRPPGLAVLMIGDNPASATYVRNKERSCGKIGIATLGQHFPADTFQEVLMDTISDLNNDDRVDGILVQLPLPPHLDSVALLNHIAPKKDVDGLHPLNLGRLLRGEMSLRSCTPAGIMRLLSEYDIDLAGKRVIIIGRSILVGKPLALMCLEANATVTIAHSRTTDLGALTRTADVLVAAVGRPEMITADMVKPGAVVIDVGINRIETATGNRLVGDVAFSAVSPNVAAITPVPGGVGPMTVTMLLENTVLSYQHRMGLV